MTDDSSSIPTLRTTSQPARIETEPCDDTLSLSAMHFPRRKKNAARDSLMSGTSGLAQICETRIERSQLPSPGDGINQTETRLSSQGEEKGPEYRETFYGKFERQIALPQGVEADKIAARFEHGVLEVRVPLPANLAGRQIPIQIEQSSNKKIESKAA